MTAPIDREPSGLSPEDVEYLRFDAMMEFNIGYYISAAIKRGIADRIEATFAGSHQDAKGVNPTGLDCEPTPFEANFLPGGQVWAQRITQDVLDAYKIQHPKWWRRMDGTPILNDVKVLMARAFCDAWQAALASNANAGQQDERSKASNQEKEDAARWRWLSDCTRWTCDLNQFSGMGNRQYIWATQFLAPYHEENGGLAGAMDYAIAASQPSSAPSVRAQGGDREA